MLNLNAIPSRRRSRAFEQYFTRPEIGDLLVSQMTLCNASHVVELGAGQGSLLAAARRRWRDARLTSVDIDGSLGVRGDSRANHRHLIMNVLSPAFARSRTLGVADFDAAVCNPPYQLTDIAAPYRSLLRMVGLHAALPKEGGLPADLVFLAHNLRLLRQGGQMGIIVPDGTATGERSRPLREALLSAHSVNSIIELPSRAFPGTDAKTFILTIEKGGRSSSSIPIFTADSSALLSTPIYITPEEAAFRMDYKFYSWHRKTSDTKVEYLADIPGIEVMRGQWNATAARQHGLPILHSTDIPARPSDRQMALPPSLVHSDYRNALRARKGDIILTRVGRNLENRFARVASGEAVVSDCLYVIRGPATSMSRLWRSLNSKDGQAYLAANARGVCARVLNKSSLLEFPVPVTP